MAKRSVDGLADRLRKNSKRSRSGFQAAFLLFLKRRAFFKRDGNVCGGILYGNSRSELEHSRACAISQFGDGHKSARFNELKEWKIGHQVLRERASLEMGNLSGPGTAT
ncbi:hypothetical protein [Bradyrhizobium ottawaense]|uniref:hypothetical protein n=1 Tax=Bradyrhizobium ottawaense TaxID=931866 RepID=UPI0030F48B74